MQSQEFILLGQVSGKIDSVLLKQQEQSGHINQLFQGLEGVRGELSKLPCTAHTEKLGELETWQACHNGDDKKIKGEIKVEKIKAGLSLKNGLFLAAAGCGGSVIGGIIVWYLTCGIH